MSRPSSGQRARPSSGKNLRGSQTGISYEDLLVAQYLEELRKTPGKNGVNGGHSPYGQKLSHTHIVPTQRPLSAAASLNRSGPKPKIDAKFIADPELWDPATPREKPPPRSVRKRPISAPVYNRRPLSATYGGSFAGSRPASAKLHSVGRRVRPLYKRTVHTIVVTAFKNGSRDISAKVAAPSIKILLEIATEKLGLSGAGRRVFLDDGTEVYTPKEIPRDADVYVSMGENFRDPYKSAKKHSTQQQSIAWTMNGLLWNNDGKKKNPKIRLSKRFQGRIEQSRRRVLVFRNGRGTEGVEIVADPERFEDFLQWCTAKLELGSYARVLFDWEGNEIQDLKEAPVLDNCLQTWSTPVLGPLWVSKGECFNPLGVDEFLSGLITYTKAKLKEANLYQKQLRFAQDENTRCNVEIVAILSMAESEIEETLEIVAHDIEDFSNALNRLNQQLSKINDIMGAPKETFMDTDFTLSHIKEIKADSKHVGLKGLRLKVYENGTYEKPNIFYFNLGQALRGIRDKESLNVTIMARLLDECSNCQRLATPTQTPNIKPVAQKLYDNQGNEIDKWRDLEYDQEVWLSFGEPWKSPFTFVLTLAFDKVHVFEVIQGSLDNTRIGCLREQLFSEDTKVKFKLSNFDLLDGVPQDYAYADKTGADEFQMNEVMSVGSDAPMLRSKDNDALLLYGDLTVDEARKPNLWPSKAQSFRITQEGQIRSKVVPNLVLAVSEHPVHCTLTHPVVGESQTEVQGYHVELKARAASSPSQDWNFTPDGFISSSAHPGLFLTYLGSRAGQDLVTNTAEGAPSNIRCYIAVCNKLEGKDTKAQRWAVKQEATDEKGKFMYTQTENREWNKLGYSWPVKEDGAFDTNFDWPLEGMLVPYAPPVRKSDMGGKKSAVPLRLLAMKNGVRDISKAVSVVGPDLTNMKKDVVKKKQHKLKVNRRMRDSGHGADFTDDGSVHCDEDLTVLKLEFVMFLERCTTMLNLPFAARRLFDEKGREHFTLSALERDQLVYISTGDAWTSPELTKGEQQRRHLLSNLASDVNQIRQFMALRNPQKITITEADDVVIKEQK